MEGSGSPARGEIGAFSPAEARRGTAEALAEVAQCVFTTVRSAADAVAHALRPFTAAAVPHAESAEHAAQGCQGL